MLNLNNSRLRADSSRMVGLNSAVSKVEEGTLLQAVIESGKETALATTGASTETVIGFAQSNAGSFSVAPRYEEITVPATSPYTVTLANAPIAGTISVREISSGTAFTGVDAVDLDATTEYSLSGRVLSFVAADASKVLRVQYSYTPTVIEAQALYGQFPFEDPQGVIGAVGVIYFADELYITNFDPSSDWWNASPGKIYSGANGKVTKTNTGVLLPGCSVVAAPNATNPFLGLRVRF